MNTSSGPGTVRGAIILGIAAVATMAGSVTAGASELDGPLINSTCSYEQIDRALHAERPDLAAKMDADPLRKAAMQFYFGQTVSQRRSLTQQYMDANPAGMARLKEWAAAHPQEIQRGRAAAAQIAKSCHKY